MACRNAIFTRITWQFNNLSYLKLEDELLSRCLKDGGTACLALVVEEYPLPVEFHGAVKKSCSASDLDACVAWTTSVFSNHADAHDKACQLGIAGSCTFKGVSLETRDEACKKTQNPWTCFVANPSAEFCDSGVWPACDAETWPENRWGNIFWAERLLIEPSSMTASWQNLSLGRQALRTSNYGWPPTPMPLAEIDKTFGAACDAGNAYGCTEGANAAVNVSLEFRTQERIDHAVKSLNTGCKNGDYLACWFLLSVENTPPEQAMIQAKNACYAAPRGVRSYPEICRTYVHLWMAEVGITPWVIDSTLARPELINICAQQKDRYTCLITSETTLFELSTPQPLALPQYAAGLDAARIACAQNSPRGCNVFLDIAKGWPSTTNESLEGLAKDICAKRPQMCDTVNDYIKPLK